MTNPTPEPTPESSKKKTSRLLLGILLVLAALAVSGLVYFFPEIQNRLTSPTGTIPPTITMPPVEAVVEITPTLTPTALPSPSATFTPQKSNTPPAMTLPSDDLGLIVLSLRENGTAHLFAYHPVTHQFIRLTNNVWDDISPAINPESKKIAYSSRQNGYWDIYILDLETGEKHQITDTAEYEGSPSWSPDGSWLAYETFRNGNFDIGILPVDNPAETILLTELPSADYVPSWSPSGRKIAYISNQNGDPEVWIADLDKVEDRFSSISSPLGSQNANHPVWSPDGSKLAWTNQENGLATLFSWDGQNIREEGFGEWPAWSPDQELLASVYQEPNASYFTIYNRATKAFYLPPIHIPGQVEGIDWKTGSLPGILPEKLTAAMQSTPPSLWEPIMTATPQGPSGRNILALLANVNVAYPYLQDKVDESFVALRSRIGQEAGWDALFNLENAIIPLSVPLSPGLKEDWLYTGRAIALNPVSMDAGWMIITRENFGVETYWRIFVRARYQDGSQGRPIPYQAWDLNARYTGDSMAYETGGKVSSTAPAGYWIDLTSLANAYGWERLPSLDNWRIYYPAIRFNELVICEGLSWQAAMDEIYPQEIFITPTSPIPPTATPTSTPKYMRQRSPTPSPTMTITPTRRPTWTPLP